MSVRVGERRLTTSCFRLPITSSLSSWLTLAPSAGSVSGSSAPTVVDVVVTLSGCASSFRCAASCSCFLISDGGMKGLEVYCARQTTDLACERLGRCRVRMPLGADSPWKEPADADVCLPLRSALAGRRSSGLVPRSIASELLLNKTAEMKFKQFRSHGFSSNKPHVLLVFFGEERVSTEELMRFRKVILFGDFYSDNKPNTDLVTFDCVQVVHLISSNIVNASLCCSVDLALPALSSNFYSDVMVQFPTTSPTPSQNARYFSCRVTLHTRNYSTTYSDYLTFELSSKRQRQTSHRLNIWQGKNNELKWTMRQYGQYMEDTVDLGLNACTLWRRLQHPPVSGRCGSWGAVEEGASPSSSLKREEPPSKSQVPVLLSRAVSPPESVLQTCRPGNIFLLLKKPLQLRRIHLKDTLPKIFILISKNPLSGTQASPHSHSWPRRMTPLKLTCL